MLLAGSEGRQVRLLQRALGVPADGAYGPGNSAAVRRFQASRGLTVDGIVGPATATRSPSTRRPCSPGTPSCATSTAKPANPRPGT